MNIRSSLIFSQLVSRTQLKVLCCCLVVLASSLSNIPVADAQTSSLVSSMGSKNPSWGQLAESERTILSPLEADWNSITPEGKQKWVQVAHKFEKLPSTEQERLRSRMTEWAKLSANERRIARDNYLQSLNIPSDKKAEAWQAYQQLSPEEKKKLAEGVNKKPSLVNSPSLKSK